MKYFFYLLLVLASNLKAQESTLQQVHVFFRHGSRTPDLADMYPTDPYGSETFSSIGYGELTNQGKMKSFKLGQSLRNRYQTFLGDLYTTGIVEARSTFPERTRMSLLLVLAGLFPPAPSQQWHNSFNWLPVPFNYEETSKDFILRHPIFYCPAYVKEVKRVRQSAEVRKYMQNHLKFFQYLEEHSKKPINTILDVFLLYHTLHSEHSMNLTLPGWAKAIYPFKIHAVAAQRTFIETSTPLLKKLIGGRMLGKVINQMLAKANDSLQPRNRKLFLYSGHDYNVFGTLGVLNMLKPHVPEYSSSILIELHLVENIYGVKIFYMREPGATPELQQLDDCDVLCPLSRFVELTKYRIPVNYTAECESNVNLD